MKALVFLAALAVSGGAQALEMALTPAGEEIVYWCARTVVVDAQGYSDIERVCGWWTRDGRLVKRGR